MSPYKRSAFFRGAVESVLAAAVLVSAASVVAAAKRGETPAPKPPADRRASPAVPCAWAGTVKCLLAATATSTDADLSVVQRASATAIASGDPVTFTIDVANGGPATATNVQLVDQIPAGARFVSTTSGGCSYGSGLVSCLLSQVATATVQTISIVVRPRLAGTATSVATVSGAPNDPNPANNSASVSVQVSAPPPGSNLEYRPLFPCRLLDTRDPSGPTGGAPLQPQGGTDLYFSVGGRCGVGISASSIAANVAVTQPTALGTLTIYPADEPLPLAATIAFGSGQTRASNAVLRLSFDTNPAIRVHNGSSGTVHVIVDVNGCFSYP